MTCLFKPIKLNLEFLPTLGYDLKIACAKFQGNWFIIVAEIDEKHALQNYQNGCGPGYSQLLVTVSNVMLITLVLLEPYIIIYGLNHIINQ